MTGVLRSGGSIFREGAHIHYDVEGGGPAVTLLHGFLGSTHSWSGIMPGLSEQYGCVAIDLVGHGQSDSPADPARYSMAHCVEDVVAVLAELGVEATAVIGYSMGGRVALHLAIEKGSPVGALVCESANPGIEDPVERDARAQADDELAQKIYEEGLPAFVDWWEDLPLFASQARLSPYARSRLRAQRLNTDPVGAANSLRGIGTGRQASLWRRLGMVKVPALIVAGADDEKYVGIAREMTLGIEDAALSIIEDAGHAAHLEQPERFLDVAFNFLSQDRRIAGGG
jgi:2-succinyl-6-hydroxy-2,4-cyclohexadiene-1-carboxylate synthase